VKDHIAGISRRFLQGKWQFQRIPINERASARTWSFSSRNTGLCLFRDWQKLKALFALKGGFMKELILDEPTANDWWKITSHHKSSFFPIPAPRRNAFQSLVSFRWLISSRMSSPALVPMAG